MRTPRTKDHSMPSQPPTTARPLLFAGLLPILVLPGADAAAQGSSLQGLDLRVTQADIEPSVTIKEYENRTVEEYSVNNNTYMVKITPNAGAPYYLVDQDGSGEMEWRRNTPGMDTQVPQWTLFSW
jgi:hypothetical protein